MFDPFSPETDVTKPPLAPATPAQPPAPPLGIGHLMLWTGCCAALLTIDNFPYRALEAKLSFGLSDDRFFDGVRAILAGPAVAALLIGASRRRRGLKFPVQPGEWLLTLQGVGTLLVLLATIAWASPLADPNSTTWLFVIPTGLMAVAYLYSAWAPPLPKWWRCLFCAQATMWGFSCAQMLVMSFLGYFGSAYYWLTMPYGVLHTLIRVAVFAVLVVCLGIDHKKRLRRGWLHWTGVANVVLSLALEVAIFIYYRWLAG